MLFVIISAFIFLVYLQTGFFALYKNPKSPVNRWFFLIAIYLAILSVLYSSSLFRDAEPIQYLMIIRTTWSLLPFMIFQFHYLLTGVPNNKKTYHFWFYGFLFTGLFIFLYTFLILISVDISKLPELEYFIVLQLLWRYLFTGLILSTVFSITYQYYQWRKQITWKKQRMNFGIVFFTFISVASIDFLLHITIPEFLFTNYLKMPHFLLFPWFLNIAFGFVRYRFAAPDPAIAAKEVLKYLPQVLFFCDQEAKLKETNLVSLNILAKKKKDIANHRIHNFFSDKNLIQDLINEAINADHSSPQVVEIISASGNKIPVEISCTSLKDKFGDIYGFVLYGQDYRNTIKIKQEIESRRQLEVSLRQISENLEEKVEDHTKKLRQSLEKAEKQAASRIHTENKIRIELEDMEVMLGEIHTRIIKNINIILLMLNHDSFKNLTGKENENIETLIRRICAIKLVNTQIQANENYGLVKFKRFLELLIDVYEKRFFEIHPVKLSGGSQTIWVDQALPLGIAVNEVLSCIILLMIKNRMVLNNKLHIKFEIVDGSVCRLSFEINRINETICQPDFTIGKDDLQLAWSLIEEQLGGTLNLCPQEDRLVSIQVPVNVLRRGHLGINS